MPNPPSILLTRPIAQSERFAEKLRERFGDISNIVISPLLKIEPTGNKVDLSDRPAIVLTSENAVSALCTGQFPEGLEAFCVGAQTAKAARDAGMIVTVGEGGANELAELILRSEPKSSYLHVHGENVHGSLVRMLQEAGRNARNQVVYRQVPLALSDHALSVLRDAGPVVVPLFSPRTAQLISNAVGDVGGNVTVVALSGAVAEAVGLPVRRIMISEKPSSAAMIEAISRSLTS